MILSIFSYAVLAVGISSSEKCLFVSFVHFEIELFLLFSCKSSLYIHIKILDI